MTEYDEEIEHGTELAAVAAEMSSALRRESERIGTPGGQPIPPDSALATGDTDYCTAWRREVRASQMFWRWVKQHSHFVTDQDLGILLRILAGDSDASMTGGRHTDGTD